MSTSATRLVSIIFATMLIAAGAWAGAAVAQEEADGAAAVHRGNTDIVFESAGTNGLPTERYQAFDQFASEHPEIAKERHKYSITQLLADIIRRRGFDGIRFPSSIVC